MYLEHFQLEKFPFTLTPNVEFFCNLSGHQAALNVILFSLGSGDGFIKITGEVGAGKTILCRKLLNTLDDTYVTAYIPNPDLNPSGLHRAFARELGIAIPGHVDHAGLLELMTKKLLELNAAGKKVVLLIDEVQAVPDESLEAIRLLTNLETETEKLLQIVLFAQPELNSRLNKNEFRQLKQRIIFSYNLIPLTREEMNSYLCHRLAIAGYTKGSIFFPDACDLLFKASKGIPRVINILCHKSMLVAYGQDKKVVDKLSMQKAVQDSQDITKPKYSRLKRFFIFCGVFMVFVGFGALYYEYLAYLFNF
jgi:MSHA biogenesis protein MshM